MLNRSYCLQAPAAMDRSFDVGRCELQNRRHQ
jgi:hypothetical protein